MNSNGFAMVLLGVAMAVIGFVAVWLVIIQPIVAQLQAGLPF